MRRSSPPLRPSGRRAAFSVALALAIAIAGATCVSAHRLDEYLQAARLNIDPDRVELQLDLTPGIALADRIVAEIDRNRDGAISDDELRAYAAVVQNGITLAVDGHQLQPQLVEKHLPAVGAIPQGTGTIQLRWVARLPPLSAGPHRLFYRNTHHRDIGVYLANVLVPANDRVAVTGQDRDMDQREFTVAYELRDAQTRGSRGFALAGIGGVLAGCVFAGVALVGGRRQRSASC